MTKFLIDLILNNGTQIRTQDEFDSEDDAVNQCQTYGINGYYSRTTKTYWGPTCISHMKVTPKDEANKL